MLKPELPKYWAVYDLSSNTHEVHSSLGEVVIDKLPSLEAAKAVSILCTLGHIGMDEDYGLHIITEPTPGYITVLDEDYADDEELVEDDGPDEDYVDDYAEAFETEHMTMPRGKR